MKSVFAALVLTIVDFVRPGLTLARNLVHARDTGTPDTRLCGTERNPDALGYYWLSHSMAPAPEPDSDLRARVGIERTPKSHNASPLKISEMSFGALSPKAIEALNVGAKQGRFYHDAEGHVDPGKLYDSAQRDEIKHSQGFKPGHGGLHSGKKVTEETAEARRHGADEGDAHDWHASRFDRRGLLRRGARVHGVDRVHSGQALPHRDLFNWHLSDWHHGAGCVASAQPGGRRSGRTGGMHPYEDARVAAQYHVSGGPDPSTRPSPAFPDNAIQCSPSAEDGRTARLPASEYPDDAPDDTEWRNAADADSFAPQIDLRLARAKQNNGAIA